MKRSVLLEIVTAGATAALLAGCLPVANYHSARTLAEGESSFGTTFSMTTYADAEGERITLPGLIPELTYHIGVTDDFEFGGRVAPGFLYGEVDAKYRFLRSDGLHMAVAPAIGQMAFLVTVTTARLPLLLTYELTPRFAVNLGVNATLWNVNGVDADDDDSLFAPDENFMTTTGASFGFEISGETAYLRPSFEISRAVIGGGGGMSDRDSLQIGAVVLHFGVVQGRELKKLEEMDRKLDEINDKLSWRHRHKPAQQ